MAEKERTKNRLLQAEGIEVAKASGVQFGRPKKLITAEFIRVYYEWKSGSIKAVDAMRLLNMKARTFYRRVKEYEESLAN
ncbi:DNA invertase Pin-like site-specific DNA recombinase [Paenibacillus eucommiae]|uniref:DNA invertase Pin-like site-specific DNA recombinase n=1 Tax=Paenibacillus eucommiae TaxID=1355755 RepID=A0ABS4J9Z0_9BACL|nr:DNA invertase Pin-like site-specific DNA recombinase [Paenibacillus eucommiae]